MTDIFGPGSSVERPVRLTHTEMQVIGAALVRAEATDPDWYPDNRVIRRKITKALRRGRTERRNILRNRGIEP